MTLLPPNSTPMERALEQTSGLLADLPLPVADIWNPATCPPQLLPWLAWGLSIDFWDTNWTDQEKRDAIAGTIEQQRRKGTLASLRNVLDRIDPAIGLVEWFDDPETLAPHTFRLELPQAAESEVTYDAALVDVLLRDIAAVKPLRSHMQAVHRLYAQGQVGLVGGAQAALYVRTEGVADTQTAADPIWATYLQTEDGEPLQDDAGNFLEVA